MLRSLQEKEVRDYEKSLTSKELQMWNIIVTKHPWFKKFNLLQKDECQE